MRDIFAFSDIHGMYDLYRAIMDYCCEQDPEATIIFCGDACDRGPSGYRIMNELLDNWHVVYLKGNHEDLFVKAAKEIKQKFEFVNMDRKEVRDTLYWCRNYDDKFTDIKNSLYNGGLETLTDWVMDGMDMVFVDKIDHLPLTFSYEKCDFCHAAGVYPTFKRAADAEYEAKSVDQFDAESLIWTRSSFNMGWAPNRIAVFGHTPVPCLSEYMEMAWDDDIEVQPYKWVGNYNPIMTGVKIDLDTGAAFTGDAYVLNVLTMQAQGFELIDFNHTKKIEMIQL